MSLTDNSSIRRLTVGVWWTHVCYVCSDGVRIQLYYTAHQCLHHIHPPGSHFIDKLKDIEVIFLLQSLRHCIKSDESTSMTHTSTEESRCTLQKHTPVHM